jgi:hypothetical protein
MASVSGVVDRLLNNKWCKQDAMMSNNQVSITKVYRAILAEYICNSEPLSDFSTAMIQLRFLRAKNL